jgi:ABC-type sugar transport system substrate-binding protein
MKKFLNLVFATLLICGASVMTSCSKSDNPAPPFKGGIAMIVKDGTIEYFQQIESSFRSECQKRGLLAEYYCTDSEYAYETQIEAVKDLEKRCKDGLKGIIYARCKSLDGKTADAEVAALAKKLNIPVILIDTDVDENSPLADCPIIGTDSEASAKLLAEKVTETEMAGFALINTPAVERSKTFKEQKPGADIYVVSTNELGEKVGEVFDQYDTFVFFNGHSAAEELDLAKANNKTIYTFDVYESTLKELLTDGTSLKGILAQNTFEMAVKAVDAVLNNSKENQWITPVFINKDNLDDPSVKQFLDYYKF